MGGKQNKCCCCPSCTGKSACCKCACEYLCVTFTPDNPTLICKPISVELPLRDDYYEGYINGKYIRYYFNKTDSGCFFKLQSPELGFTGEDEESWDFSSEIVCDTLETSVIVVYGFCGSGILESKCAKKIQPQLCTGCDCNPECLCVRLTQDSQENQNSAGCFGEPCWDPIKQAYTGYLGCYDENSPPIYVEFFLARWGDYCDENDPYTGEMCIDNDTCGLVYNGVWKPACGNSDTPIVWEVGDEEMIVWRRTCEQPCHSVDCCPMPIPDVVYATVVYTPFCMEEFVYVIPLQRSFRAYSGETFAHYESEFSSYIRVSLTCLPGTDGFWSMMFESWSKSVDAPPGPGVPPGYHYTEAKKTSCSPFGVEGFVGMGACSAEGVYGTFQAPYVTISISG